MSIAEKEISLLQKQIDKLEQKDFDLEAWKNYTSIILGRIFGEESQKIRQVRRIEYEHSSWSLRDTAGHSAIDACRKLGKEILQASIAELENFGAPSTGSESNEELIMIITEALKNELKGYQYKEIKSILNSEDEVEEKQRKIAEKFQSYGTDTAILILSQILSSPKIGKELP